VPRRGQAAAAVGAQVVLAIGRRHLALGVLHQAAAVGAVRQPEGVADLVHRGLGQPLPRVQRRARPAPVAAEGGDDAGQPVEGAEPEHAPVGEVALPRRDVRAGQPEDAQRIGRRALGQHLEQHLGPPAPPGRIPRPVGQRPPRQHLHLDGVEALERLHHQRHVGLGQGRPERREVHHLARRLGRPDQPEEEKEP
jgi:hypothetical protein